MPKPQHPTEPETISYCPCCGTDLTRFRIARSADPRGRPRKIPDSVVAEAKAGEKIKDLAKKHGVTKEGIMARLKKLGYRREPSYTLLPDSIGAEYQAGATLLELATKHETSTNEITKKLESLGVERRKKGLPGITAAQIADILKRDLAMEPHPKIGKRHGISRERVRQICIQGGNPARRERIVARATEAIQPLLDQLELTRSNKELLRKMWADGKTTTEIGLALKLSPRTAAQKISIMRKKNPKLFPYRNPNHWAIRGK